MRVLIVSRVAWNSSTNFGSTYSSFFGGMEDVEIAHVYFGSGKPDTIIAKAFFRVTEKDVLDSLLKRKKECGQRVFCTEKSEVVEKNRFQESTVRSIILYLGRDLLFRTGVWKTKDLEQFIQDFSPDIVFTPIYGYLYMHWIERYIKKIANCPMISFVSDDNYSLKQFNLSPMYWIYRFLLRSEVRKTVKAGDGLFTISELQRRELSSRSRGYLSRWSFMCLPLFVQSKNLVKRTGAKQTATTRSLTSVVCGD